MKTAQQILDEVELEEKKPFDWKAMYKRFDKELPNDPELVAIRKKLKRGK